MANESKQRGGVRWLVRYLVVIGVTAVVTVAVVALLINIFTRKQEARFPYQRMVEVTEDTTDPQVWGQNWPREYDSYRRTVDYQLTRYGGSDAVPRQKLDMYPWLRSMWAGYAFSLDYRESRGHAYMLADQDHTERVLQRPQPGACLHCHASILPAYRFAGKGDVMEGFRIVCAMKWNDARRMTDDQGKALVEHPASCVDCHDPKTMQVRVTRPAFLNGIRAYMAAQGKADFDPNRDATRQQMRTFVCAQCHVEYYFKKPDNVVTYPWAQGLNVDQEEAYYEAVGHTDWPHGMTGAPMLKAQHPEFEMFSQGTHARAGVACADCHMPYIREGAMKVSDHHVRSPLLNVARACQTCHNVPEAKLVQRAQTIQDRTAELIDRASGALMQMIDAVVAARAAGVSEEDLGPALQLHRKAQWRLDWVFSENSHGFHADQESARILGESIDYARQGQLYATAAARGKVPMPPPGTQPAVPVRGVTPTEAAPPGNVRE